MRINDFLDIADSENGFDGVLAAGGLSLPDLYALRGADGFGTPGYTAENAAQKALSDDLCSITPFIEAAGNDRLLESVAKMFFHRTMCARGALREWRRYMRVYSIDADWYADFIKTEDIAIDFSLLTKLPYDSFYIDLSEVRTRKTKHYADVIGAIVTVIDNERIHVVVIDADNVQYNPVAFYGDEEPYSTLVYGMRETAPAWQIRKKLPDGTVYGEFLKKHGKAEKIPAVFPESWKKYDTGKIRFVDFMLKKDTSAGRLDSGGHVFRSFGWEADISGSPMEANDLMSPVIDSMMRFVIQFLYFLHSKTEDIQENCGRTYHAKAPDGKKGPVGVWDVGYRYGKKIRTVEKKKSLYGDAVTAVPRSRPRAYVRCAHWHRHWCGSGAEKRLEPRWHEPSYCSGTVSDIITEINTVTDADGASCGERAVKSYLDRMGVRYVTEYAAEVKGHARRFDFAVEFGGRKMFIEFDGEQHFRSVEAFGGKEGFRERQRADWDKNRYAKKNRIPLLRIRYDQMGDIPEIIDSFFEKPVVGILNPRMSNAKYYAPPDEKK